MNTPTWMHSLLVARRAAITCLLPLALTGCFTPDADPPGQLDARPGIQSPVRPAGQKEAPRKASADDTRRALSGQWARGTLRRVQDGDSLIIRGADGLDYTLRLSGIDAPERSQPFANRARQHLLTLTQGQQLSYLATKRDQYGRLVVLLRATPAAPLPRRDATGSKEKGARQGSGWTDTETRQSREVAGAGHAETSERLGKTGRTQTRRGKPIDVNQAMLDAGLAWYFWRFESDLPAEKRAPYRAAEAAARKARRGLWSEPGPQAPWDFRRQKREEQAARKQARE